VLALVLGSSDSKTTKAYKHERRVPALRSPSPSPRRLVQQVLRRFRRLLDLLIAPPSTFRPGYPKNVIASAWSPSKAPNKRQNGCGIFLLPYISQSRWCGLIQNTATKQSMGAVASPRLCQTRKYVRYATDGIERADETKLFEVYHKTRNLPKTLAPAYMSAGCWQLHFLFKMQGIRNTFGILLLTDTGIKTSIFSTEL